MSENVYTVQARTAGQGASEDILLAAREHPEDGYRYEAVWADRLTRQSGVEGLYDTGTGKFRRGDGFGGRDD